MGRGSAETWKHLRDGERNLLCEPWRSMLLKWYLNTAFAWGRGDNAPSPFLWSTLVSNSHRLFKSPLSWRFWMSPFLPYSIWVESLAFCMLIRRRYLTVPSLCRLVALVTWVPTSPSTLEEHPPQMASPPRSTSLPSSPTYPHSLPPLFPT